MRLSTSHPRSDAVSLLWFYVDSATREIAMQVYGSLIPRLPKDLNLLIGWWNFATLRRKKVMDWAAYEAGHADMIFCSVNDSEEFSAAGRTWLDLWLSRKSKSESALVALIRKQSGAAGPTAAEGFLRTAARSAKMDFFVKEFAAPTVPSSAQIRERLGLPHRHEVPSPAASEAFDDQASRKRTHFVHTRARSGEHSAKNVKVISLFEA